MPLASLLFNLHEYSLDVAGYNLGCHLIWYISSGLLFNLGTHTGVLEARGKHLPAHGRVTQACVCPPAGHPIPTSAEATKALALRSPAVASHGPPRPILS